MMFGVQGDAPPEDSSAVLDKGREDERTGRGVLVAARMKKTTQ
jgi:hypothetical protein